MRVTVVTTWFPSDRNPGAGSFNARDARALSLDHDVTVVHFVAPRLDDGRRAFRHDGIHVTRLPIDVRTPRGMLHAAGEVQRLTRGSDVVHTMAAPAVLPFLLRRPTSPWVHTEHWSGIARLADDRRPFRSGAARFLSRIPAERPDEVVAVSDYLAERVRAVRRGPVSVIGNIVDPPPLVPRRRDAGDRRIRVIGVGNVVAGKGWRLAVDAVAALRAEGRDVELVWLGDGPQYDELLETGGGASLRAPGRVDRDRLAQEFADADVFVLPTERETFSLVTVEALAAGLPIVATGDGAHLTFIRPGIGTVVTRDAESIARGIVRAAEYDRKAVRALGAQIASRFDERSFRRAYTEVYKRVSG